MGGDVAESPLDVLVLRQLQAEVSRLQAAHLEDGVVGRQHAPVDQHHVLVVVVSPGVWGQICVYGGVYTHTYAMLL